MRLLVLGVKEARRATPATKAPQAPAVLLVLSFAVGKVRKVQPVMQASKARVVKWALVAKARPDMPARLVTVVLPAPMGTPDALAFAAQHWWVRPAQPAIPASPERRVQPDTLVLKAAHRAALPVRLDLRACEVRKAPRVT
jgi:hypothetical protein